MTFASGEFTVGIDIGTTSVKAVAVDGTGCHLELVLVEYLAHYNQHRPTAPWISALQDTWE